MDKIIQDFKQAHNLICRMDTNNLESPNIPTELKEFEIKIIQLAYLFSQECETSEINNLQEDTYKALDIISKLDNKWFITNEINPELKDLNQYAVRLAFFKHKGFFKNSRITEKGIYWCTRDLKISPIGNHHFITLVCDKNIELDISVSPKIEMEEKQGLYFYTFGAVDKGKLKLIINSKTDIKSVNETTHWYKPDSDFEAHKIKGLKRIDYFALLIHNYLKNQSNSNIPKYKLTSCNCATWVNTLLQTMGVSKKDRSKYSNFGGIDWAENNTFSNNYFREIITKVKELV